MNFSITIKWEGLLHLIKPILSVSNVWELSFMKNSSMNSIVEKLNDCYENKE